MAEHVRIERLPTLRRPFLVAAFRGWNDGAQGASLAASYLAQAWGAQRFGDVDPEEFYDFQATRPHVALVDGVTRRIEWPENAFYTAPLPGEERDAVLLIGIEPNVRWRTFTGEVVGLAQELGVELLVTLGALLADVPHTRPAPVTGSATDPELVRELGLAASRYEGPTGIVGVLHDACRTAGMPSASLWAAVPHYASLAASPKAALALCRRLADLVGASVELGDLERAAEAYERQVSDAVAQDEDTEAYVHELERRRDALGEELDVPSGDALAAELTRFLREHEARRREDEEGG
ncbi:MAG: PAC2 family protein [Thermoleophilia bacterium]|nr:PAC2 family protein [Thermoleophilia bacterium]